jgi:hypothetical protein
VTPRRGAQAVDAGIVQDDKLFPVGVICRPEVLATVVVTILPAIVSTPGSLVS